MLIVYLISAVVAIIVTILYVRICILIRKKRMQELVTLRQKYDNMEYDIMKLKDALDDDNLTQLQIVKLSEILDAYLFDHNALRERIKKQGQKLI